MSVRLVVVLLISLFTVPVFARDPTPGEVFQQATAKFDAKRFREAAELFEKAFQLAPTAQAAYNAGIAWDESDERARAASSLTRAVNLGELSKAELREASRRLALLVPTLGKLVLESPRGARAKVGDDEELVPGVLYVVPGEHSLVVTLPDGKLRRESVSIGAGQSRTFAFRDKEPARAPAVAPKRDQPAPKQKPGSTSKVLGYVSLGLAGAFVAGGVVLNLSGASQNDKYEDSGRTDRDARDSAVRLRTFAFVAYGAGAVFGAVGTILLVSSGPSENGVAYRTRF